MGAYEAATEVRAILLRAVVGESEAADAARFRDMVAELIRDEAFARRMPVFALPEEDFLDPSLAYSLSVVAHEVPDVRVRKQHVLDGFRDLMELLEDLRAESDSQPPGVESTDDFLSRVYRVLELQGTRLAIGTLMIARRRDWRSHVGGYGYVREWILALEIDDQQFFQRSGEHWDERAAEISDAAREVLPTQLNGPTDRFFGVVIEKRVKPVPNWRHQGRAFLRGEGINNQGRVRSDNLASIVEDGLRFRSLPEINFYKAAKAAGLVFAPLPVFLQGGRSYQRIEPDFVVIADGKVFIIELDGDAYHLESPADADRRIRILKHEGAHVERIAASACDTEEKAHAQVKWLQEVIEKLRRQK